MAEKTEGAGNLNEGAGAYGTVHVMEDEMRDAELGVFEAKSGEPRRRRKAEPEPENKMEATPANKSATKRKARS